MIIKYLDSHRNISESIKMPKRIDHTADTLNRTGSIIRNIVKEDTLNNVDNTIKEFLLKNYMTGAYKSTSPGSAVRFSYQQKFFIPNLICAASSDQDATQDVNALTFIPFIRISDNLDKVTIKIISDDPNNPGYQSFSVFRSLMLNDLAMAIERNVKDVNNVNIRVEYETVKIIGMNAYEKSYCILGCLCVLLPENRGAETFCSRNAGSIFSPKYAVDMSFVDDGYLLDCCCVPPEYYSAHPDSTGRGERCPLHSYIEFFNRVCRITKKAEVLLYPSSGVLGSLINDIESVVTEITNMNSNDLVYAGGLQKISYISLQRLPLFDDYNFTDIMKIFQPGSALSKLIQSALPVGIVVQPGLFAWLSLEQFNKMSGYDIGDDDYRMIVSDSRNSAYTCCIIRPDKRTIEFTDCWEKDTKDTKCYKI